MFAPHVSGEEASGTIPSMPSERSGMTATSTSTEAGRSGPYRPAPDISPSERSGMTATVSKVKARSDKKELRVKVGKLRYKGQTKPYAIVPPELIDSQEALTELLTFWGMPPNPDLIVELNSTRKAEGTLVTEKNMPFVLQDVFCATGVEEHHADEESGHGPDVSNDGRPDQDQALYQKPPFHPSAWVRDQVLPAQQRQKQQQAQPPQPPEPPQDGGLFGGVNRSAGVKSQSEPRNVGRTAMNVSFRDDLINSITSPSPPFESTSDLKSRRLSRQDPTYHTSWTNRYVQRKVVEALSGIVSATDMLRGIILCVGTPSGNERLLEAAVDLEGSAPSILAVDDLDRYVFNDFGKEMKEHLEGSALTIAELSEDDKDEEVIEIDISSEENVPQTVLCPGTTLSYPSPTREDSLFWDDDGKTITGKMPWFRASHLIFSTEHERFQPETLGRSGHICINGGCREYRKATGHIIREAVTTVRPCLLFNNTGAETQAYAKLINEIERQDKALIEKSKAESRNKSVFSKVFFSSKSGNDNDETTQQINFLEVSQGQASSPADGRDVPHYEKLKTILRQKIEKLLTYSNFGLEDANCLSIADALHIIDMYTANPRIFHSVVVPCDPLNESPDAITVKMMQAYARADLEKKEVGAGNVDSRAVEKAWRLHRHLETSKLTKSRWRSLLYNVYIIFAFGTTLAAVLERLEGDASRWVVLGLATVVSISLGILNLTAPDEQLNKIQAAQARILYEVFHFCLRVGKYSLDVRERDDAEDETKEKGGADKESSIDDAEAIRQNRSRNRSTAMMLARMRFSQAMRDISSDIESLDLYYDQLAQGPLSESNRLEFEDHVAQTLNISGSNNRGDVAIALSGIITAKDYHNIRLVPSIDLLEHKEDRLRKLTRGIQITSLLASTAAVVVSAIEEGTQYIPAIVALATGFTQYLKVYDYERRFAITSKAAREVASLDSYWQSLSPLKQFTGDGKATMVHSCEVVLLQYNTNSSIQLDKDEIGLGEDNDAFLQEQSKAISFGARSA